MKLKIIIILVIQILAFKFAAGQQSMISVNTVAVVDKIFSKYDDQLLTVDTYMFGVSYQYIPRQGQFFVSGGLQYIGNEKILMLPLSLHLRFGERIKIFAGGGPAPGYKFNPGKFDKNMFLGWMLNGGLEVQVTKRISVFSSFGLCFIPEWRWRPDHFGGGQKEKIRNSIQALEIGIRWLLTKPAEEG